MLGLVSATAARAEGPEVGAPSPAHGALVVARSQDAAPAARSLARLVYADAVLRPAIDDSTAQVLVGEPVPEGAPPALVQLAELWAALPTAGSATAERRLLGGLGSNVGALLVVSVTLSPDGTPSARVIRVAGAYEEPTVLTAGPPDPLNTASGPTWPGAIKALRGLVPAPLAPKAQPAPAPPGPAAEPSFLPTSPWFWGPIAVVAAAGITVLAVSQASSSGSPTAHVSGRVDP